MRRGGPGGCGSPGACCPSGDHRCCCGGRASRALFYNGAHLYAGGLILGGAGHAFGLPVTITDLGLIWIAHVGFDRMLGYGLKEPSGFHDTHLGRIGRR
ncbi:MAG: DUF4260 family protein [Paracoccaceae bacterium]